MTSEPENNIDEQVTTGEVTEFRIKRAIPGRRLDRHLAMRRAQYSRTLIQKLIRRGEITVNGEVVKPSYEVRKGDIIRAAFPPVEEFVAKPEDIPIDIIYEDDCLLAVNKPADIVTHPAPGHVGGTLLNAILHHCGPLADQDPERPGIVHRLDKDTTGIILFAKTENARRNLQQQFEHRLVHKVYTAVVENDPELDADLVDLPIGPSTTHKEKMAIDLHDGKTAQTVYHVLERFGDYTLVRCEPRTGRTHQIRLHMAAIGHPIACDDLYGAAAPVFPSTIESRIQHTDDEEPLIERQALHATIITFNHPATGRQMELEAPLHDDFTRLLDALRRRGPVARRRPRRGIRRRRS